MTQPSPSQLWRAAHDAHPSDPLAARDAYRTSMLELGYIEPGMPMTAPMPCGWPHYPDLDPHKAMYRAQGHGECGLCTDPYEGGEWVVLLPGAVVAHLDCALHAAGRGRLKPAPLGPMRQVNPIEAQRSPQPCEPTLDLLEHPPEPKVSDVVLLAAIAVALGVALWLLTMPL